VVAILTISPTLIAFAIMLISVLIGRPISFERIGWLLTDAQILFLVIGVVAILLARKAEESMSPWRIAANKWVGRAMAAAGLFYAVAFVVVAHHVS
jgi:hypothetical protein